VALAISTVPSAVTRSTERRLSQNQAVPAGEPAETATKRQSADPVWEMARPGG